MVIARAGLLLRTLAVFLSIFSLNPVSALFDSVWESDDDIASIYADELEQTDNAVSSLWQLIFSDSSEEYSTRFGRLGEEAEESVVGSSGVEVNVNNVDENLKRKNRDADRKYVKRQTVVLPREQERSQNRYHGDIPTKYVLNVDLADASNVPSNDDLTHLQAAIATVLNITLDHVHVTTKKTWQAELGLYFVRSGADPNNWDIDDLLTASEVESSLEKAGVKGWDDHSGAGVQAQVQHPVSMQTYEVDFWRQPYILVFATVAAIVLMGGLFLVIWCCIRRKEAPDKLPFPTQQSALLTSPIPQQICLFPAAKPNVNNAMAIQPDAPNIQPDVSQILANRAAFMMGTPMCAPGTPLSSSSTGSPVYSSSSTSGTPIPGTPVHTPPLRIKAKGLLERRGSNASLTLELGTGTTSDSSHMGTPPKESSVEEYLLSAGNRMSRRQLQQCLYNVKAIYQEFWEIPMNHPDKIILPGSGIKNRYRTIIPNETTRVKLPEVDGDPLSTYINANYIRGYGGEPKSYIATQGAMCNTVLDMWRMVWHEKAPIIIMITKLKEKNKNKCECYVPDFHDTFGDIDVLVEGISEKEGYIIRNLRLRHKGEEHEVLHYWYTAWPDHKAPNTARQLLALVKEVKTRRRDEHTNQVKGPVIVHCSAGIGRTGCFIAASIGLQQLQQEHMVDILNIVCNMRLDRGGMVQTNEQYEFVHQALILYEQELPDKPPTGD